MQVEHFAGGIQCQRGCRDRICPRRAHFHADDGAAHGFRRWRLFFLIGDTVLHGHGDLLAARLVQDLTKGRIAGQVQGKTAQELVQRIAAVIADGIDFAAADIFQHQTFQQIIDIAGCKGQFEFLLSRHFTAALEIADAAIEQHHLAHR